MAKSGEPLAIAVQTSVRQRGNSVSVMKAAAILNQLCSVPQQGLRESQRQYSVAIVFHDAATLEAALDVHRHWISEPRPFQPNFSFWNIDSLRHPAVFEAAAASAGNADLVVFSIHAEDKLDSPVEMWMEQWLPFQRGRDSGLVALFTGKLPLSVSTPPALEYLHEAALSAGMRFDSFSTGVNCPTKPSSLVCSLGRAHGGEPVWKQRMEAVQRFRHGGINE